MIILQVNYCFKNMTRAQWETRYTDETAQKFLAVDGLLWKIWLDGPDEPRVGGIYLFATRAQAEAYLAGPIVARMRSNPDIENLETRIFNVRDRMSAITHAPVPGLAEILSSQAAE
jgi:hypothetical protein